ncbi:CDP-diacylglycerol--glycerol-3-phosphate 3-phosphatidyltransferase [Verrucomicrobiales bacterium]|jgi:CDP-diacylglycerol---glycerol-3-phosphate 3-phosphatidyltransferase|nr:CDP-diacylglycerol--glycerol-3-phosphate 3-phosphatidyltransferase [Verrucomicrobiales bacterium]MDA7926564.1 CDP-diacylglycerol--glycerol-3-phosphate 3-phosphatidyltransferase [Verrucomicrobiales bacterium]
MNLPNKLTVARLVLSFVFVALLSTEGLPFGKTAALIAFCIAAFTDFLDGYLARKHNLVTNFGKLMDPLADKILMCAGFVLLTRLDLIPAWVVVVILSREFLVTGLRLLASAEGVVLAAENLGKYKTVFQIVTVIYFLLILAAAEPAFAWISPLFNISIFSPAILGQGLIWVSLILTLLSGVSYVWKNRKILGDC